MRTLLAAAALLAATPALAAPSPFAAADITAIYKAAGFKPQGKGWSGCDAADPGWPRSQFFIEAVDLNGDGKLEAFVGEGNVACYGRNEQGFTIVARDAAGKWRKLGGGSGVPTALPSQTRGWADIQAGGPGFARLPVMRWTGTAYGDPR